MPELCSDAGVFAHPGAAAHYEAWYTTPEGRRANVLEKAVLSEMLEMFPCVDHVLEVGCGTGHFTRWLRAQGITAVGIDLSSAMLREAKTLGGVPLVQANACHLPFPDGAFDVIMLVTTLAFLPRPREALAQALRVSRYGLLLGVLNRWSVLGVQRHLKSRLRATLYDKAHFYGVRELVALLRAVAGEAPTIHWRTTLFPRWWPWPHGKWQWGSFIAAALVLGSSSRTLPQGGR